MAVHTWEEEEEEWNVKDTTIEKKMNTVTATFLSLDFSLDEYGLCIMYIMGLDHQTKVCSKLSIGQLKQRKN
jgi:hypothetical protein